MFCLILSVNLMVENVIQIMSRIMCRRQGKTLKKNRKIYLIYAKKIRFEILVHVLLRLMNI